MVWYGTSVAGVGELFAGCGLTGAAGGLELCAEGFVVAFEVRIFATYGGEFCCQTCKQRSEVIQPRDELVVLARDA